MSAPHTLSKSDFKLARTCATKLYYRELRYPDTNADNEYLALLAEGGYMVEQLAKQRFPDGIVVPYDLPPAEASLETLRLLRRPEVVLFEGTLVAGARMARVDILRRSTTGIDLYEVKASKLDPVDAEKRIAKTGSAFGNLTRPAELASDWIEYLEDVTYQVMVLRELMPDVPIRAHLMLMNGDAVAERDGMPAWFRIVRRESGRVHTAEFIGDREAARRSKLVTSIDVTAEVGRLMPDVKRAADEFVASLTPDLRRIPPVLDRRCRKCEFATDEAVERNGFLQCWGDRGLVQPHILGLYQGREFLDELIASGVSGVAEIPDAALAARTGSYAIRQRIQVEHARSGTEWVGSGLGIALRAARHPLHFIDFEAAGMAIPHHKGMKPFGRIAWQWSCHTIATPGAAPTHAEYIHEPADWPNERFARTLRDAVGDEGTIFVWSPFEGSVLRGTADDLTAMGSGDTELAEWLRRTARAPATAGARIIDLLKVCRDAYYHPLMEGSNSIKDVLDAVWRTSPEVRALFERIEGHAGDPSLGPYAALPALGILGTPQRVADGTGAIRAYFAMTYGAERDDVATKAAWRKLLLDYCRLDTLAMVLIWDHWMRITEE